MPDLTDACWAAVDMFPGLYKAGDSEANREEECLVEPVVRVYRPGDMVGVRGRGARFVEVYEPYEIMPPHLLALH